MIRSDTTPFGRLLRRHRLVAGLSQEALAERAGLSARGIRALEGGRRVNPRPETVRLLADALGLDESARTQLAAAARPDAVASDGHADRADGVCRLAISPLRIPPTRLIGREREVAAACALLAVSGVRLLTLTGPGGVGKSRLAHAIAEAVIDDAGREVAWVELAPLPADADGSSELVAAVIARTVGLKDCPGRSAIDHLFAALRPHALLLMLDNFEHIMGAAPLVARLLGACPQVSVLATSRERLRLRGERVMPVAPLAAPEPRSGSDGLGGAPAVRLFAERAAAVCPGFALTADNVKAVAEICRRLDGLPLAIELVAPRIPQFAPEALLAMLDGPGGSRLPMLAGGARDLPARQQTMRHAIAWSYALLGDDEQALFRRLAVFVGGFSLHAAAAVQGPDGTSALDLVASLLDKSLLKTAEAAAPGQDRRFTMLETIREFGLERLAASGEEDASRERHAAWCLDLAERSWQATMHEPVSADWLGRIGAERDNLLAALRWLEGNGEPERFVRLAGALLVLWVYRDHASDGNDWLGRALARTEVPEAVRAKALLTAALVAWALGDVDRMESLHDEQVGLARTLGDDLGWGVGLHGLGDVALFRGEYDRAEALLADALAHFQASGRAAWAALTVYRQGVAAQARGDLDRAEAIQVRALDLHRDVDDPWGTAMVLDALGAIVCERGEVRAAATRHLSSLPYWIKLGTNDGLSFWLANVAVVAVAAGQFVEAARLLGAAQVMGTAQVRTPWRERLERATEHARGTLGDEQFAGLLVEGRRLPAETALDAAQAVLREFAGDPGMPTP